MENKKDFAEYQVAAHILLDLIFQYMPENPERFSQELQQSLVLNSIDKAIFAMQIITGLKQLSCSEIVHTTYESLNPNIKQNND